MKKRLTGQERGKPIGFWLIRAMLGKTRLNGWDITFLKKEYLSGRFTHPEIVVEKISQCISPPGEGVFICEKPLEYNHVDFLFQVGYL